MNNENLKIIGYDPQTGQPIYEVQNQIQTNNNMQQTTTNFEHTVQENLSIENTNYQNVVQTPSDKPNVDKKSKGKTNKVLIITNVITAIFLALFVVMFILKDTNNDCAEPNEITLEEKSYNKTATTEPVSKDWKKYQFSINGKTLSLPCLYMEFKDISGFSMKSYNEKSYLERNSSTYVNLYIGDIEKEKLALYIDIKNNTSEDLQYTKSEIVSLWQTNYQVETNNAEAIIFPGNLSVGMEVSKDQIIELFGEPTDIDEYSSTNYESITLTYNGDTTYSTINYYKIEIKNGKIDALTLDHKKNNE